MDTGQLTVQARTGSGKSEVRKLRASGKIPGICYGANQEPIAIALDVKTLRKALDPVKGRNTLLRMNIEGLHQGTTNIAVLLKDTQMDALRDEPIHADFVCVDVSKPVRVTVPVVLLGKAEGVKEGGTLHLEYRNLPLLCTPDKIPAKIEVDVSGLGIGQAVHIADLKLDAGIRPALSLETTLCVVTAPKAEKAESATTAATPEAAPADAKKAAAPDDKAKASAKGK